MTNLPLKRKYCKTKDYSHKTDSILEEHYKYKYKDFTMG